MTAAVKWVPQDGPQTDAIDAALVFQELLFGGARGGGKGLRLSEPILTPFGFKPIGDLRVGNRICATDGTVQKIIGYYPRGRQPIYRLRWSDGSETVCDSDHIWLGWMSNTSVKVGNRRTSGSASARKWTTSEIVEFYQRPAATKRRFGIPIMEQPCAFNVHGENRGPYKHITRTVPAYVLGVLLGDGSLAGSSVRFTTADPEIAERVEAELPDGFTLTKGAGEIDYGIRGMRGHIGDLGLTQHRAEDKFIPRIYLHGTVDERWALMQGLMDTDGWADPDGDCYFTSVSVRLAEDVRYLARSLGAMVTWREKTPTYTYNNEQREGQRAYTLRIKVPQPERLFGLERKKELCRGKAPQSMALWLESIDPCGEEETVCIAVSHPSSLFVIDNFVVTHNTAFLLGDFLMDIERGDQWHGILFRKTYPELDEVVRLSMQMYMPEGAEYKVGAYTWEFPGGSTLKFRHLDSVHDAAKYQGHSYQWIGWDELTNWPNLDAYHALKATLRGGGKGQRIRATANPGGPGHVAVKSYFIDAAEPMEPVMGDGEMVRTFIPSKVRDNQILLRNDPTYIKRLEAVGDPQLVRAWLEGDWDVLLGQYFDNFRRERVVIPSFEIDPNWPLFGAMDYGESNPTAFLLFAVDYDDIVYLVNEYYMADRSATEHAQAIKQMIEGTPHTYGRMPATIWADPSMWTKRRLDESMNRSPADVFKQYGLFLKPANNDRINGWRMCKDALTKDKFKVFDGWGDAFLRTVPPLPRDTRKVEDIDTTAEDHAADAWRYGMVHEYRPAKINAQQYKGTAQELLDNLMKAAKKKR